MTVNINTFSMTACCADVIMMAYEGVDSLSSGRIILIYHKMGQDDGVGGGITQSPFYTLPLLRRHMSS